MRRKKSIVPTSLPLRSTAWTRWVWVSTSGVFRLSAWLVSLALIATVVWSQWGIIQPVAASAMRNVAVVVLGEDALGPVSNSPVATVLEPASVKQREGLTSAISDAKTRASSAAVSLPAGSDATLLAVIAECEPSIIDPSAQSVAVTFCTQQIASEAKKITDAASAAEAKKAADAAKAAADAQKAAEDAQRAAEEAARQQQQREQEQQQEQNSGGGDSNSGNSGNSGGGGGSRARTVVVSCTTGPATVTVSDPGGGGGTQTIPAGGSASFTVYSGASMSASGGNCSMAFG